MHWYLIGVAVLILLPYWLYAVIRFATAAYFRSLSIYHQKLQNKGERK